MDERQVAQEYMTKHGVNKLFKRLLVLILLERPSDVRQFMIKQLRTNPDKLSSKPLMDAKELETMFTMLRDPLDVETGKTSPVLGKKINNALEAMGVSEIVDADKTFDFEQFQATMKAILDKY